MFFAKVGSRGLMQRRASFSSPVPLKDKTCLASAESIDPKRDRLVEPHLSKDERWATSRKTMLPGTLAGSYFAAIL